MTVINKEKLGKAIGRIAAGLFIVSLKSGDQEAGFLASWIQQAGFEPPCLTIAFNKERSHHLELLKKSGKFVVNVMSKANAKTMSAFFKAPPEGKSVFEDLDTGLRETGVPVLKDSVAYIECKYLNQMESGDHIIVLAEIVNAELHNPQWEPATHLRKNGFQY